MPTTPRSIPRTRGLALDWRVLRSESADRCLLDQSVLAKMPERERALVPSPLARCDGIAGTVLERITTRFKMLIGINNGIYRNRGSELAE